MEIYVRVKARSNICYISSTIKNQFDLGFRIHKVLKHFLITVTAGSACDHVSKV